jgi:hypothetical protein
MQTTDSIPKRTHTFHPACQITFSLSAKVQRNRTVLRPVESLGFLKGDLVEQIRRKTTEATIDVFQQDGQGCSYNFRVMCRFKSRMHSFVVRRIFAQSIRVQRAFHISPNTCIKVCQTSLDNVRQSYVSQPPEKGERWLHHSLLCSKAHDMPLPEFVEELGKTVQREEINLLGCLSWEQYKEQAWTMQALLYSIHKVLLTKCNGSSGREQGTGLDVGTAAALAPPRHPSNKDTPCLPSSAESSTPCYETDGVLNLTKDATAATSQDNDDIDNEGISRRLNFSGMGTQALRPDALAPVETPEQRERPSGDLQARDTISRMGGSKGITAAQFCFGCSEADLHFEAGPAVSGAGAGPSASNRTSTSSRVYLRDLSAISQQLAFS